MDENIRNALGNEVLAQLLALDQLEVGSEEKSRAIDGLVKLYNLGLNENRQDNDNELQFAKLNSDLQNDNKKLLLDITDLVIKAAGVILPIMISVRFMDMGFQFEQTGTYTSKTFQNGFGMFRPKTK